MYDYEVESGGSSHNYTGHALNCTFGDDEDQVLCNGKVFESSEYYKPGEALFYIYLGAYVAATLFAGESNLF